MNRNRLVDFIKAAAIFGVVFIHAPGGSLNLQPLFGLSVPVFVTLFACFLELALAKRTETAQRTYLSARLVRLGIPYLFWSILYILLFHDALMELSKKPFASIFNGWLGGFGWAGQYFLVVLFQLLLIFPWMRKLVTPNSLKWILGLGFCVYLGFDLFLQRFSIATSETVHGNSRRLFLFWMPDAMLGVALARSAVPRSWRFGGLCVCILSVSLCFCETRDLFSHRAIFKLVTQHFASIGLMIALAPWIQSPVPADSRKEQPRTTSNWWFGGLARSVEYVGKHTFPIFLANPLVIHFLHQRLFAGSGTATVGELQHIAITLFVMAVCLCLGAVFHRLSLAMLVGE